MKSGLHFLIHKIKSYWRLFFQRLPILRNATGIALIVFGALYCIRFDEPLDFQFFDPGAKIQFVQEDVLLNLYKSSASLELFDTAPLFIPTQWNYASTVLPEKRVSSDAEFVSFEPLIEIEESIELTRIEYDPASQDYGASYENTFFDPRLLALFIPNAQKLKKGFSNDRFLKVEILENSGYSVSQEGAIFKLAYDLNEDEDTLLNNLSPVVVFFRNDSSLAAKPTVYKSSLSEIFDEQILEWLNQPRHIALLPKGFLKLTFYPY